MRLVCGSQGKRSRARFVAVRFTGALSAGAPAFSAEGEGGGNASGCGAAYAFWGGARAVLRQGGAALDLGGAAGELRGAGGALSRATAEDGLRYRHLSKTAVWRISGE